MHASLGLHMLRHQHAMLFKLEYICPCTYIWVRPRNWDCLVTWFCYQLIAKPGNKTAPVPWPDPYIGIYMCTNPWHSTKQQKNMCISYWPYSRIIKSIASVSNRNKSDTLNRFPINIDQRGLVIWDVSYCRVYWQLPSPTTCYTHRPLYWDTSGIWKYVQISWFNREWFDLRIQSALRSKIETASCQPTCRSTDIGTVTVGDFFWLGLDLLSPGICIAIFEILIFNDDFCDHVLGNSGEI